MGTLKNVEQQANIYMFDLKNLALENGCQTDDNWQVKQASLDEKKELERDYQLTMSGKYLPEEMAKLLKLIQIKLNQPALMNGSDINTINNGGEYLIAYHTGKPKR